MEMEIWGKRINRIKHPKDNHFYETAQEHKSKFNNDSIYIWSSKKKKDGELSEANDPQAHYLPLYDVGKREGDYIWSLETAQKRAENRLRTVPFDGEEVCLSCQDKKKDGYIGESESCDQQHPGRPSACKECIINRLMSTRMP
jgi:hypothetical protein